ncbi:3-hydroxyisobutyrate dehydrogenase-like beta-hydroxyacid dehydrogenase [Kribbella antiqua]|uniref:3-hydroxyisobutyrate dehydrogenase-like beta-hydroxyacid dehydrogenase n=1 Tax=Kribbella antiqua TaxID=2512217 RepID=A0A4R2IVY5_9ACTN|nr:NAD(P)-dependent oxidoreductase [Kribbella antiqua]TCO48388.1 3-hydroxyisobutyrate dehydrogenase-like beta-hydroxyacid dehydrogenase [Kribbella antiqua]
MRIAVFHPGAMGSKLAAQLVAAGHEVHWVPDGRSEASVARAAEAGLIGTPFAEAVDAAEVVLCSCAPQGAVDIAVQVGKAGFGGLYIEANPLSPASLREAQAAVPQATFVDAGVVGPPPTGGSSPTHLMLSGSAAQQAASLWAGTAVTPMVVGDEPGAASAAKSSYALYNKGKAALAVLAFQLAEKHGVTEALTAQQVRADAGSLQDPSLPDQLRRVAWRWGPEFDELAATLDDAGLEGDAARALRQVWTKLT